MVPCLYVFIYSFQVSCQNNFLRLVSILIQTIAVLSATGSLSLLRAEMMLWKVEARGI